MAKFPLLLLSSLLLAACTKTVEAPPAAPTVPARFVAFAELSPNTSSATISCCESGGSDRKWILSSVIGLRKPT